MCCNNLKQKAGESDEDDAGNAEQTGDDDVDDREVDRQADELPEKADNKEQDIAQNGVENEFQYAFDRLESWYKGDGVYGDGPELAWDYYNSYVIYPMLMELHDIFPELSDKKQKDRLLLRAKRYAAIQEKMIAPDGTFIVTGRSIAYRCGAFHHLANMALREELPQELSYGAVRCALGEVIQRTLWPASFREDGFLAIGVCGSQPSLGEPYISTGSLYLCLTAFLPLGLSPDAPFWTEADQDWTQRRLWKGQDMARDISYHE